MTFIKSKIRMITSLANMYVFLRPFSSLFRLFIYFFLRRAGLFAIKIFMPIGEKHSRTSNEKFQHKGRLPTYPIVPQPLCLLRRATTSSIITIHRLLQLCIILIIPIKPPLPIRTPDDLHPQPTPLQQQQQQLQTHSTILNKKSPNSDRV
jgi:hypothetical protein